MATSGRQLSRLGAIVALAAALAPAGAAAPTATFARARWCEARSGAAWQHVLSRHILALSRRTALIPLALANDGRSFFAAVYSRRFAGMAKIDGRTGAVIRIKSFADPKFDQASAAYDGRWLVWEEYHGFDSFNDFSVWAWDARTRKITKIGSAARSPSGQFWESPWRGPDVREGIATWVEGVGPDQLGEVHSYDLRNGRDLVVRHGHPGGAFLLRRHLLVWAEASARGIPTTMRAASAVTGAPARVPPALRALRNVTGLQTDGRRIAYPDAQYKALWWSAGPGDEPYEAVPTRHLHHVDNSVHVGGRWVGFGIYPDVYVADTKSGRYLQVSGRGGWALVSSDAVLVVYGTTKKVLHPVLRMAFVRLRDLPPIPACS